MGDTLENSFTRETAEHEKHSFLLCAAVKMTLRLFIHTQLYFCEDNVDELIIFGISFSSLPLLSVL